MSDIEDPVLSRTLDNRQPEKKDPPEYTFPTVGSAKLYAENANFTVENGRASRDDMPRRSWVIVELAPHKFVWKEG